MKRLKVFKKEADARAYLKNCRAPKNAGIYPELDTVTGDTRYTIRVHTQRGKHLALYEDERFQPADWPPNVPSTPLGGQVMTSTVQADLAKRQ